MRLLLRKPVVPLASLALLGTHSLRGALRSLYRLHKRTTKAASGGDVKLAIGGAEILPQWIPTCPGMTDAHGRGKGRSRARRGGTSLK